MTHNWFWAADAADGKPAGERFVIANGQPALWARVRREFGHERVSWDALHRGKKIPDLGDILKLFVIVENAYGVSRNRLVSEAAQIPVFAQFVRDHCDVCDCVSNPVWGGGPTIVEGYSREALDRLASIVERTLGFSEE